MSTVSVGRLSAEDLGRPIRLVGGDPLGVLAKVEHRTDGGEPWTVVTTVTDGLPRQNPFASTKRVVLGGSPC